MIEIRQAQSSEYEAVRDFYYAVIDAMETMEFAPGWERDIYPTQKFLQSSIQNGELFAGIADTRIVSCMVVNHEYNEGYRNIRWSVDVADSELLVIHTLGVHPEFSGRGIAKQMVRFVMELARETGIKTIRLDVLDRNLPAEKAYTRLGFRYVDTMRIFYEDTGWADFRLFEYMV